MSSISMLSSLSVPELIHEFPVLLQSSKTCEACLEQITTKIAEGVVTDAQVSTILKSLAKEVRGRRGVLRWLLDELLPLLSCPVPLLDHILQFISEDAKEEILFLVERCSQLVDEDRTLVIPVLATLGDLAALLSSSLAFQSRESIISSSSSTSLTATSQADSKQLRKVERKLSAKFSKLSAAQAIPETPIDAIRAKIFEVCTNSMDLVELEQLPTLIRTLLFSLTPTNARRGFQALREATNRFSAEDLAPLLPVVHTALRLTPQLATSFLAFVDALPLLLPLDLHILTMVLTSPVPIHVERAWEALKGAFLRKSAAPQLLRLFAVETSRFGHITEELCSETVLFNIFEHFLHAPNAFLIEIACDFSSALYFHFPALRMQVLDALLAASFTLLGRSSTDLEMEKFSERKGFLALLSKTRSKQTGKISTAKVPTKCAHWSNETWRFPMKSILELCAKMPKLVAPFHQLVEDSFLQWSQKGATVTIEKMTEVERRHWQTHMHSTSAALVFLAPVRLGFFSTLLMLIQKLICSGNPLAQSSGIILAQHTIQASWIDPQDVRIVYAHLLTHCPTMPPKIRSFYYELIATCAHKVDDGQLLETQNLVSQAIANIGLISTPTKPLPEDELYFGTSPSRMHGKETERTEITTHFNVEALASWIGGASQASQAKGTEHVQQLLRCYLMVTRRLNTKAFENLIRAPLYMGPDWKFCLDSINRAYRAVNRGRDLSIPEVQILQATAEMLKLATTVLETVCQVICDDRLSRVLHAINSAPHLHLNDDESIETSFPSIFFQASILPLQRRLVSSNTSKGAGIIAEAYNSEYADEMVHLLEQRMVSILELHHRISDLYSAIPIVSVSSLTSATLKQSKSEGTAREEYVMFAPTSYLIPMNIAWSLLLRHLDTKSITIRDNQAIPTEEEHARIVSTSLASIYSWLSLTTPIPMTISDTPNASENLASVALVTYDNLAKFHEISRNSSELVSLCSAPSQYLYSPLNLFSMTVQSILPEDTFTDDETSATVPNFVLRFGSSGTGSNLLVQLITSSSLVWTLLATIKKEWSGDTTISSLPALNLISMLLAFSYQLDATSCFTSSGNHLVPSQSRLLVALFKSLGSDLPQQQSDREACQSVVGAISTQLLHHFTIEEAYTPLLFGSALLLRLLSPVLPLSHQRLPQVLDVLMKKRYDHSNHLFAVMTRSICALYFGFARTGTLFRPMEIEWLLSMTNAYAKRSEWRETILKEAESVATQMAEEGVSDVQPIRHPLFGILTQETVGGIGEILLELEIVELKKLENLADSNLENPLSYCLSVVNHVKSLLLLCKDVSTVVGATVWMDSRRTRQKMLEIAKSIQPLLLACIWWRQTGLKKSYDHERNASDDDEEKENQADTVRKAWSVSILRPIFAASRQLLDTVSKLEKASKEANDLAESDRSGANGQRKKKKFFGITASIRKAQMTFKLLSQAHHIEMEEELEHDEDESQPKVKKAAPMTAPPLSILAQHLPVELNSYQPSMLTEAERQHVTVLIPRSKKPKEAPLPAVPMPTVEPEPPLPDVMDVDEDFMMQFSEDDAVREEKKRKRVPPARRVVYSSSMDIDESEEEEDDMFRESEKPEKRQLRARPAAPTTPPKSETVVNIVPTKSLTQNIVKMPKKPVVVPSSRNKYAPPPLAGLPKKTYVFQSTWENTETISTASVAKEPKKKEVPSQTQLAPQAVGLKKPPPSLSTPKAVAKHVVSQTVDLTDGDAQTPPKVVSLSPVAVERVSPKMPVQPPVTTLPSQYSAIPKDSTPQQVVQEPKASRKSAHPVPSYIASSSAPTAPTTFASASITQPHAPNPESTPKKAVSASANGATFSSPNVPPPFPVDSYLPLPQLHPLFLAAPPAMAPSAAPKRAASATASPVPANLLPAPANLLPAPHKISQPKKPAPVQTATPAASKQVSKVAPAQTVPAAPPARAPVKSQPPKPTYVFQSYAPETAVQHAPKRPPTFAPHKAPPPAPRATPKAQATKPKYVFQSWDPTSTSKEPTKEDAKK